jgi:hypothetical protein
MVWQYPKGVTEYDLEYLRMSMNNKKFPYFLSL